MIPVVYAPTATGKSDLILAAASMLPLEIISMDSMQIYRKMDVGTAKPSETERKTVPYHMIDIVDPDEEYDVYKYVSDSKKIVNDIYHRNKIPVFVGGTGLYLETLLFGIFEGAGKDEEIRNRLMLMEEKEPGYLFRRLSEVDEESGSKLHRNDLKRIIRALEVYEMTGKPISEMGKQRAKNGEYSVIILERERSELYDRINVRADTMVKQGLIQETQSLIDSGYDESLQSMKAIGYRETIAFLKGRFGGFEEYLDTLQKNTRHYAKRQIIWGRRYDGLDVDVTSLQISGKSPKEIEKTFTETLEMLYKRKSPGNTGHF